MILEIVKFAIGVTFSSGIVATGLYFLGRTVFKHFLTLNVEQYKNDLKAKADAELAEIKHSLQLKAIEKEITLSSLQERRIAVISKLYSNLQEVLYSIKDYLNSNKEDKIKKANLAFNTWSDFIKIFKSHQIWLDKNICAKIYRCLSISGNAAKKYSDASKISYESLNAWASAYTQFTSEIPDILTNLEKEFRMLLGVIENRNS